MRDLTYVCDMCGKIEKTNKNNWSSVSVQKNGWKGGLYETYDICPKCLDRLKVVLKQGRGHGSQ